LCPGVTPLPQADLFTDSFTSRKSVVLELHTPSKRNVSAWHELQLCIFTWGNQYALRFKGIHEAMERHCSPSIADSLRLDGAGHALRPEAGVRLIR
jgi:hypothetical protein